LKPKRNVQPKNPQSPKSSASPTAKKRTAPAKKAATTKKPRVSTDSTERRTSGRHKPAPKYIETGDSTDDEKMDVEDQGSDTEPMDEIEVESDSDV
jgi:hypothetical protein